MSHPKLSQLHCNFHSSPTGGCDSVNDLASSAFYAGGIAEKALGRAAPRFILAVMLFSYAVRALYIELSTVVV